MDDKEKQLYERAVVAIEKLARETPRLVRDVQTLVNRIEPFEGDRDIEGVSYGKAKPQNFREVLDRFEVSRRHIEDAEGHVRRMGARMDQIHNDSWSRDDLKPWLKR